MKLPDSPSPSPVRFFLVDDHEMYRQGLRCLLERRPGWQIVGECASASEALQIFRESNPHVAIVDLRLKDGDGVELVARLHESDPELRILVSSVYDEQLFADRCLRAGASGYVWKGDAAVTVVAAVEKALAGGMHFSDRMTDSLVNAAIGRRSIHPIDTFTPREREVYSMIGEGMSVKQIAGRLRLSPKTVEYHRQQVKRKCGIESSASLARYATVNAAELQRSGDERVAAGQAE